jgi:hypothetical protein
MTVTNKGRVIVICDCCREQFAIDGGDVGEVWQQALKKGWVKFSLNSHYCAPCAIGMRASKITADGGE